MIKNEKVPLDKSLCDWIQLQPDKMIKDMTEVKSLVKSKILSESLEIKLNEKTITNKKIKI